MPPNTFKRKFHRFRPPGKIIIVDTETKWSKHNVLPDSNTHCLRCWCGSWFSVGIGGISAASEIDTGNDASAFWNYVVLNAATDTPTWVIAHNCPFDLTVLDFWRECERGRFRIEWFLNHRQTTIIRTCMYDREVWFVDSMNWFRMSLAEIGKSLNFPKLDMPQPQDKPADWITYCKRDVEITAAAIAAYHKLCTTDLHSDMRYTAGSTAWSYWGQNVKPINRVKPSDTETKDWEGKAHFGGRIQLWKQGPVAGPIFNVDVRSMYPSMMANGYFPVRCLEQTGWNTIEQLQFDLRECCVIAAVELDARSYSYPRRIDKKRSTYERGHFVTILTSPELQRSIDAGEMVKPLSGCVYTRQSPFKQFCNDVYAKREVYAIDNQAFAEACKSILNSLYGRFAQRVEDWQSCEYAGIPQPWGEWSEIDHTTNAKVDYRSIAGHVQKRIEEAWAPLSSPAVAAHITAYARLYLQDIIDIAGEENVYFCHTDCVHVSEAGFERLHRLNNLWDGRLGSLHLEWIAGSVEYLTPNHYIVDGKHKCAGVSRSAEWTGKTTYRERRFERLDEIFNRPPDGTIIEKMLDGRIET